MSRLQSVKLEIRCEAIADLLHATRGYDKASFTRFEASWCFFTDCFKWKIKKRDPIYHQTCVAVPFLHSWQLLAPNVPAYRPLVHGRQLVDPVALEKVPGGHSWHPCAALVAPVTLPNVPAEHPRHWVVPVEFA